MPASAVADRDARVTFCVKKLRMTAREIFAYSQTWPWPFNFPQELDTRIGKLKLRNRIRWKHEQSTHEQFGNQVLLKVLGDAHRNGVKIEEVDREVSIPEARLRADRRFLLAGKYLFYLETEISNRSDTLLRKMKKYLAYRNAPGVGPFRVLFVYDDKYALGRVWKRCQQIMVPHRAPRLFLFAWARDVPLGQIDSCCNPVWRDDREHSKPVPLVPRPAATLRPLP